MAYMVEHLSNKFEALSSTLNTTHNNKKVHLLTFLKGNLFA
jgi:hypothetical protein